MRNRAAKVWSKRYRVGRMGRRETRMNREQTENRLDGTDTGQASWAQAVQGNRAFMTRTREQANSSTAVLVST